MADPMHQFEIHKVVDLPSFTLPGVGAIDMSITNSTVAMLAAAALVILFFAVTTAKAAVVPGRLQVIGERCASCGVMDVYVDGVRVAGIDTRAASRQARQVLYTRVIKAGVNHSVVIKARGTAGRPNVVIDAIGVRH